jgi:hypothetical protein
MKLFTLTTYFADAKLTCTATDGMTERVCRPRLTTADARLTLPEGLQHTWSARVDVNLSRCSATRGHFGIIFQREKGNVSDLEFVERFERHTGPQRTGRMDVSVDL